MAGRFPIGDDPLALEPKERDSWVPYTWSYEAHSALSKLESGLDFRGFEPRNMLGRVPPLPDRVQYGLLKPFPVNKMPRDSVMRLWINYSMTFPFTLP